MINILWRNMKWRFQNPITIAITIVQPFIWLVLYSAMASGTMQNVGIGNYASFILPGIMVLVIFGACCSGGIINFIMKSSGSFYRILISPVRRSSIVIGQILETIVLSFLEIAILCVASLFFSVKPIPSISALLIMILLIFISAFFMSGLTYTISLLLPNEVIYETIMNAIVLPVFFLSTALFPDKSLHGSLKVVVMLNPFTHIINALRTLICGGQILFLDILPVILLFVVLCIVSYGLAMWRLKKETAN